jgi:hypothetical protein
MTCLFISQPISSAPRVLAYACFTRPEATGLSTHSPRHVIAGCRR